MIKITLEIIREHNPCAGGWKKVRAVNDDQPFPASSILNSNGLDDTLWVLCCLPEYSHLWRKFACWCALEDIELIKPYTEDYDLIVDYLNNPNAHARTAARAAARAASAAADADAYAAVDAADAADAYAAARAAADAASAAAAVDAADAAAYAAAYAADAAYAAAYAAYAAYAYADTAADAADAAAGQKYSDKLRQILNTGEWVE